MKLTPEQIGTLVKQTRKAMGVTQKDLALTSGTGLRFIIELEKGKPTCQLGKVLTVMQTLGMKIDIYSPTVDLGAGYGDGSGDGSGKG
ncbi:MAG: helix-turn-helix transcriptional regulator [Rhodospirillales bacterium]|nr:helix-turn-helix transcriptional regulator [Rhodospirillales bacterium]MCB9994856.1 helix-turn-helix transcriptional regulator [Rhodospirillales bacterium]